ncbi:MAG: trypsin-like serine protease [Alphaproteobacteria bacterium]|nr:trypsin-like serine protease [Alphaproteobacteria bacterium]
MIARASAVALVVAALAGSAQAGVIRYDVADPTHLNFGADPRFASVGQIKGKTSTFSFNAAGRLIASNWVLTAAHVVDRATSMDFKVGGGTYQASSWFTFPDWNGNLSAGYDMALIRFDVDLTAATGIALARRFTRTDEIGRTGHAVGFGRTGTGLTGAVTSDQKKRAGSNKIDKLMVTPGATDRILLSDFDRPGMSSESSMGSSTPISREFLIAAGDSGGGLFVNFDGAFGLAGVHSFGYGAKDGTFNAGCGDASGHSRVSMFNAWIDAVIAQGGPVASAASLLGRSSGLTGLTAIAVPEPGAWSILVLGLLAVALQNHLRRLSTQSSIGISTRITRHRTSSAHGA